ncbi:hypothetical protein MMC11_000814 [Xylographa trunciseda]|nr:hypothetical protein [Xylographa trunciseda]
MAGRAGMRSSSRRTTPQSPPQARQPAAQPQQSKRTTRSQSREVNDGEPIVRTTRRATRGTSIESNGGPVGRKKKISARAKLPQDLSVVIERIGSTESDAQDEIHGVAEIRSGQRPGRAGMNRSPGSLSAISGTTARTSHSAQELADLDAAEMVDVLPDLADASDKILSHLVPEETSSDSIEAAVKTLQDSTSLFAKKFARLTGSFESIKKVYGNESYINVSIAVRGALKVRRASQVGVGPWRPDAIFHKANIAQLIASLFSLSAQSMRPWAEKMERDFPAPFLSNLSKSHQQVEVPGVSYLLEETLEAAFNIRMQLFLSLLNQHYREDNFDPDILLRDVFYASANSIKGWDINGLRTKELTRQHQKMIAERLDSIQEIFNEKNNLNLEALNSTYPWSRCVSHLISWAESRKDEIEAQLVLAGGVERVHSALTAETTRRTELSIGSEGIGGGDDSPLNVQLDFQPSELSHHLSDQPEQPRSAVTQSAKTTPKVNPGQVSSTVQEFLHLVKRKLAASKNLQSFKLTPMENIQPNKNHHQTSATAVSSNFGSTPISNSLAKRPPASAPAKFTNEVVFPNAASDDFQPQMDDYQPQMDDNQPQIDPLPRDERIDSIMQTFYKSVDEEDKENRPQPNATSTAPAKQRSFIDRQPNAVKISFESQAEGSRTRGGNPTPKRSRQPEPDDEDQFSDPSEDEGFQQDTRPSLLKSSLVKRHISGSAPKSPAKRVRLDQDRERTASVSSDVETAVQQSNVPQPMSNSQIYRVAQTQSKEVTALHRQKIVQKRKAWTNKEMEAFIDLIAEYGISWSLLKQMDHDKVLINRDQTALKDKARNMKVDYLTSKVTLPMHFDLIPLKQADWNKLASRGVSRPVDDEEEDE